MAKPEAIAEDAALAERAQAGDREAFAELARRYRPALVALAFDRTRNFDDAQDLAQEALARALDRLNTLREAASFGAWLRAVAANLCASWARRPAALPVHECALEDNLDVPAAVIARSEQREIARALQDLPTANRLALLMHVWYGTPYARIAEFLGVPVTTIEGRIFRAREQLRRTLQHRLASAGHTRRKEK